MARFVVCYDITSDKRRRSIVKCLEGYGDRIQDSVFELPVDGALMETCLAELTTLIKRSEDHVAVYQICGACERKRVYLGTGETAERVGEETVFIL